jgi:(1->4)-alpha-D-glucan 1-alpha-D-glucosylmutase
LRPDFGFSDATALLDYLAELGVSHVFLSPYLQAAPGSTHGYDVVDHSSVNQELGGRAAHAAMCAEIRKHGLYQMIDVVPNHMSIAARQNRWWWDILENGRVSVFARFFDVDWRGPYDWQKDKVLLPILRDHYGRVLESREIRLVRHDGDFYVRVAARELPLAPVSLPAVLRHALGLSPHDELGFLADALADLPPGTAGDAEGLERRHRDKKVIGRRLRDLFSEEPGLAGTVDQALFELNQDPDALHVILEQQNYRLAHWRAARADLDYRRFFDINELAGLRIEFREVFDALHERIKEWVDCGWVHGLRIDHSDGLRDPVEYFERLRALAPDAWIVAEKILEGGEVLPLEWPIDGTTGYDFIRVAGGLFVAGEAEAAMNATYSEFIEAEEAPDFLVELLRCKRQVLDQLLLSDLNRLTRALAIVCEHNPKHRDYAREDLRLAVRELVVHFPVYRNYVRQGRPAGPAEQRHVALATDQARSALPNVDGRLFDLLSQLLNGAASTGPEWEFVLRFQQLTGPAMAKGVEDTALYRYHRLVALNEVGGDPHRFGVSAAEFHDWCKRTQSHWPATLLTTSTHDTKRSEDVRARLVLLSQAPERWNVAVRRWSDRAQRYKVAAGPDANFEYLFWQTLVGAWPLSPERAREYFLKAVREAKLHTSWTRQNQDYERAVVAFTEGVLADAELTGDVASFVTALTPAAQAASLALTLLKLTAPGVPDIYQGSELWDHSLADPDNRRPVDYAARRAALRRAVREAPALAGRSEGGLSKLYLIRRALELRRRRPNAFGPRGRYEPLAFNGPGSDMFVAFSREDSVVVAVRTRFFAEKGDEQATQATLPPGRFVARLGAETTFEGSISAARLFAAFPVALLERED